MYKIIRSKESAYEKNNRLFGSRRIYTQFLIISLCCVLLLTLMISLFINAIQRVLLSNATNYVEMSAARFTNDLEVLCLQLDVFASQIQSEEIYKELLESPDYASLDTMLISDISDRIADLETYNVGNTSIVDIAFVNEVIHWSTLYSEEDLSELYYEIMSAETKGNYGIGLRKSSFLPLKENIYYVYCCTIYSKGQPIGCALLSIDVGKLNLDSNEESSAASFFLMDTSGTTYALSANSDLFLDTVTDTCQEYLENQADGSKPEQLSLTVQSQQFYIQMTYSDLAGCYIISAVYMPTINELLQNLFFYMGIIIGIVVLFIMLLLVILYRNMVSPLEQFSLTIKQMTQKQQRRLEEPFEISGCEEVQSLSKAFTDLFQTIEKQNDQIFETSTKLYEEKIRGQAAEISYFQSQINPHFLYNVLEQIHSIAFTRDVPEIAAIAVAMGKMYRYNAKGSPIVSLQEELDMTAAYMEIQQLRFQDKFDVLYNIPEEARSLSVIKIILQPLVENAIIHGIEPSLKKCMLYIGCTIRETEMVIEVRDDGVGIPPETLSQLRELLQTSPYDTTNYVGITNTNARLKLQYGEPYGIQIDSVEMDGTVVSIHMSPPDELKKWCIHPAHRQTVSGSEMIMTINHNTIPNS